MMCVIEKLEGQWAVIEWGKESFKIPKCMLPSSAQSGDQVKIEVMLPDGNSRLRRKRDVSLAADSLE